MIEIGQLNGYLVDIKKSSAAPNQCTRNIATALTISSKIIEQILIQVRSKDSLTDANNIGAMKLQEEITTSCLR